MRRTAALLAGVVLAWLLVGACTAEAATPGRGWRIDATAAPTDFPPVTGGTYEVEVANAGSEATRLYQPGEPKEGEPIPTILTDTVAPGLTIQSATGPGCEPPTGQEVRCEYPAVVAPDQALRFTITVSVNDPTASGPVTNEASVSGGGAPEVKTSDTNQISSEPPAFGATNFDFAIDAANGTSDTQAGDHPYELTSTIDLATVLGEQTELGRQNTDVENLKDVFVDLPLGLAGSALAAPQCTLAELASAKLSKTVRGEVLPGTGCEPDTTVGHITTEPEGTESADSPIWNITPEQGEPAEFGFIDLHENTHVFYAHIVPSPQGYLLQVSSSELSQVTLARIVVTFFGDPTEKNGAGNATALFTMPSACTGSPLTATMWIDSWQHPGALTPEGTPKLSDPNWVEKTSSSPAVTGCNLLSFDPAIYAEPTTQQTDSPTGLEFELKLPEPETPSVLATPPLRTATVTLPAGLTVNPSAANGLSACTESEVGWEGPTAQDFNGAAPTCPESSKIGSVAIESPLIGGVLHGEVFVAAQNENPFGSTLGAYILVNDPATGVLVKIAGELKTDPATGQITGSFQESPQLPFSSLSLRFFGGPRAPLATPTACGTYTTTSDLTPWSAESLVQDATPSDAFTIDEGCTAGFAPAFTAGSSSLQAGAYTGFLASFSREDSDQELGGVSVTLPPGLLANIASVPLCGEAQANAGTCPQASQIGTVAAQAGAGPDPVGVTGTAYLTGPYNGGPFGLSVVVPAIAGPFNFGNVVVRQSLRIDPRTVQVTDVSNPFPTILDPVGPNGQTDGIPIKLRRIDVNINRPGFALNPTSCEHLQATGAITSTGGLSSSLSTPFQVTNCATLKFEPKVAVATAGKASKANGASLSFKIAYPKNAQGSESWFNEAKFDLPVQLPARLTTIQKACLAATFEANPASCPSASKIGAAIVHTPVLPVPLTGPVYFVSYGGAKFPEAVMVLQGDGVTVELHGETFISKAGITSATFRNTPDTPFESIEVTVPAGPFSEFGTDLPAKDNYNLCGQKLVMPTLFKAQNGLQIEENTPISVTGCPKVLTTKQKLAAALKACRKKHGAKRGSCEKTARKKYSAKASRTSKQHTH